MQMLEAEAFPLLIGMLGSQPAAADLLCFMATQQQCKEAFLRSKALGSLVDCLHASACSGTLLTTAKWLVLLCQPTVCMAEVFITTLFLGQLMSLFHRPMNNVILRATCCHMP